MIVRRKKLLAAWDRGYWTARNGKGQPGWSATRDAHAWSVIAWAEQAGAKVGQHDFEAYCMKVALKAGLGTDEVVDDIRAEAAR